MKAIEKEKSREKLETVMRKRLYWRFCAIWVASAISAASKLNKYTAKTWRVAGRWHFLLIKNMNQGLLRSMGLLKFKDRLIPPYFGTYVASEILHAGSK